MAFVPDKKTLPKANVERPISLPKKSPQRPDITLVLDLDETLVHCSSEPMKGADFVFPVRFRGVIYQVPCQYILLTHHILGVCSQATLF